MNVLFLSNLCSRTGSLDICLPRALFLVGLLASGLLALAVWGGFHLGERHAGQTVVDHEVAALRDMLVEERRSLAAIGAEQRAHLDALALRVAELRARLIRLDALGDRLVEVGKLDKGEFDFTAEPPVGGVELTLAGEDASVADLGTDMERINALLEDRETKLLTLERMLMARELMAEVTPSGRPVKKGWLSSGFGKRTDPFTGKKSYHRGIDFAGKPGSDIIAVAAGVVTRSEYQSGYGNLVEIRHADGYSTVYAHNKENLVGVGDVVGKGETIALLGNTGRSSGPHVHLEVHRNSKIVNPRRFVR
jgi:murein DD-endopeptidase MepM/ murein hydrolase activator NlpD